VGKKILSPLDLNIWRFGFESREDLAQFGPDFYECDWKEERPAKRAKWIEENIPPEDHILYAVYDGGGYDGWARVIFVGKDGKIYEAGGSHCSCYGLEDQWDPDEVEWEQVLQYSYTYDGRYNDDLESDNPAVEIIKARYKALTGKDSPDA
jgi:hypothetical protein